MKILLIGPKKNGKESQGGPNIVFDGMASAAKNYNFVTIFPLRHYPTGVRYFKLFLILLKRWDSIHVHSNSFTAILTGIMYFRSRKTYVTIHGYVFNENKRNLLRLQQIMIIKFLFKNRIYVSNKFKEIIESKFNLKNGMVIHNGFIKSNNKGFYSSVEKKFDICSFCGFNQTKGIEFLLNSFSNYNSSLKIKIAGHYIERINNYNKLIDKLENIEIEGILNHDDLLLNIKQSKICINPSKFETFGITTLEAMSLGVPVIVSYGAGISEILTNGENAMLIEYGDEKKLVNIVHELLKNENLYKRLSINGKKFSESFSWDKKFTEYLGIFKRK